MFFSAPGVITRLHTNLELPLSIPELCAAIAELGIYDTVAKAFYNIDLKDTSSIQWRLADDIAQGMLTPRLPCRCRAFVVVMVAVLRSRGVAARARCGFASYLVDGFNEDHWLCEYWAGGEWRLCDPQLDVVWKQKVGVCPCDLPEGAFATAGQVWRRCRSGHADPATFGIHNVQALRGLWFIAGNVVRDACALLKIEMNPWDCWGPMQPPHAPWPEESLAFFDKLATLTIDENLEALLALYKEDDSPIKLPMAILNPLTNQVDQLPFPFDSHLYEDDDDTA